MEIWSLVFAGISAIAAAISAITSIILRKEIKQIKTDLKNSTINITSQENKGAMVGINNGEVKWWKQK